MKFLLSREDWRLSRQALPLVIEARWRLWRTPFPVLHAQWRAQVQGAMDEAAARGLAPDPAQDPDQKQINEVWDCAHAVSRTARLVPLASCLTQAMTLQLLLAQRGHFCTVCIGVERAKTPVKTVGATSDLSASDLSASDLSASGEAKAASPAHGSDAAAGKFRAHAWVEWRGRVVIGGDVRRWKPLTIFAPVAPPAQNASTG